MKRISILAVLMAAALLLSACGAKQEETPAPQPEETAAAETQQPAQPEPEPTAAAVVLTDVSAAMAEGAGITDPLYLDTEAFGNLYGIDASWVAQSSGFATMSGVFPDEVALFEAVNAEAAAQIADCLQNRLNEVMVQAETYDPESYEKAKQCSVVTNGNFVRMLLSPKQAELAAVYGRYIQELP